jgi:hypothetical protein
MFDDQQFSELIEASLLELQIKTEAHKANWGLGEFDRWETDQVRGHLVLTGRKGITATCPAQYVGSYGRTGGTWLWAWANPSISDSLKIDSLKVKEFGNAHQIEHLILPEFVSNEIEGWAFTALAVKLCGAQGGFQAPSGTTASFLTFGEVTLSNSETPRGRWRWPWSK